MTGMSTNPSFSDLTTIGVGGAIRSFIEPHTRAELLDAVRSTDEAGRRLCVIGGGSNMLVGDDAFDGVVIRDARRDITLLDADTGTAAVGMPAHDEAPGDVLIRAQAGCHWDDFVRASISAGCQGVEGLSGIPGTVGASVVQNIGAYGQEVSASVDSVEVWDRAGACVGTLGTREMGFGYRMSALKRSMLQTDVPDVEQPGASRFSPTPRYVVISVTFRLHRGGEGVLGYDQLARALHAQVGDRMPVGDIRSAVLAVRAAKGMLEDAHRYERPFMRGCVDERGLREALRAQSEQSDVGAGPVTDRHSCGSFFMNPMLTPQAARALPEDAPRFDAGSDTGDKTIKTSAAWLIDHAGFHRGFVVRPGAKAALSSRHTLALTNLGGARAHDVVELAQTVQRGVHRAFGVCLTPEPVVVGLPLH